jgi:hypothetical protein
LSDRQAAHYYRRQHARALQREEQWEQRALAAERIIAQLLVLVGCCVEEIRALKGQLSWLKKQQFGRKSEATKANDLAGSVQGAAEGSEQAAAVEGASQSRGGRGQQRGRKGPKRRRRLNLPEAIMHHTLELAERLCQICGKVRPELGLREQSEEIGWEVRVVRRRHVRHRYGPSCDCAQGRGIRTAPKPAKLIAKGLFAVDFWVQVLLKKFEFQQPLQRTVRELKAHGLEVSPGNADWRTAKDQGASPAAGRPVCPAEPGGIALAVG